MSLLNLISSGALMGKSSTGDPKLDLITKSVGQAREEIANMFPQQSTVGRAMRAFNAANNPISGAIKMIGSIFSGKKYRSDQYRAGEKYMLYILNIDIHSYRKVDDATVPEALQFFSTLLGVSIESWTGIEELRSDLSLFKKNRKPVESDEKLQAAQLLLKQLPWNDVAGAWINPLMEMANKETANGSVVADVQNVAVGMGLPKNFILYAVGFGLVLLFLSRRK